MREYEQYEWRSKDLGEPHTPITADRLNEIEKALARISRVENTFVGQGSPPHDHPDIQPGDHWIDTLTGNTYTLERDF